MMKRGVKQSSVQNTKVFKKIVLGLNAVLTMIGSVFVDMLDSLYHALVVRSHALPEKGFTIIYHQNWITHEIVEVTFRFRKAVSDSWLYQFLHGVITRACSTMPVDVVYVPRGQARGTSKRLNVCTMPVKNKASIAKAVSHASCIDPSCNDRSFEVWENRDARSFLRFHFPKGKVVEVSVTGNRPLLRRVFHFA